jgi:hypothetical protein
MGGAMISLLSRVGLPQAIGVYWTDEAVHASWVMATPLGHVELSRYSEPPVPQQPGETVARLLRGLQPRSSRRIPVVVGLPSDQVYFTTRPINPGSTDASPRVLLREALRSANVPIDEMHVDVVTSRPDRRPVASIVSGKRECIDATIDALQQQGLSPVRVEPAPCALLRTALRSDRVDRRAKVAIRVFLNDTHLLAVLTARNQPVMWRRVPMARGDETSALLTAVRSLASAGEHCGVPTEPSAVTVHGRFDLRRLLDVSWIQEQLGIPIRWLDGPELRGAPIAYGLAQACFDENGGGFNLVRHRASKPSLREIFPWQELMFQVALLVLMAVFLGHRLLVSRDACATVTSINAQSATASMSVVDLQNERNRLQQRVAAAKRFLDSRILWTRYHRELADSLPDNVFLTSLHGTNELATPGKRGKTKAKKSLILKGAVTLPEGGAIPYEVDRLLTTLRSHPTLTDDFPLMELAELKQLRDARTQQALAMFTVVCLPKEGGGER